MRKILLYSLITVVSVTAIIALIKYFKSGKDYTSCVTVTWECTDCYESVNEKQSNSKYYHYNLKLKNNCDQPVEVFIMHGGAHSASYNPVAHVYLLQPNEEVSRVCGVNGAATETWTYYDENRQVHNNAILTYVYFARKYGDNVVKFPIDISTTDHATDEDTESAEAAANLDSLAAIEALEEEEEETVSEAENNRLSNDENNVSNETIIESNQRKQSQFQLQYDGFYKSDAEQYWACRFYPNGRVVLLHQITVNENLNSFIWGFLVREQETMTATYKITNNEVIVTADSDPNYKIKFQIKDNKLYDNDNGMQVVYFVRM